MLFIVFACVHMQLSNTLIIINVCMNQINFSLACEKPPEEAILEIAIIILS